MAILWYQWLLAFSFFTYAHRPPRAVEGRMHPFYVSVLQITHNAATQTLEISCKTFTNDFETTLEKAFHHKTDLYHPDTAVVNKEIFAYLQKHLALKLDGQPVHFEYVGFERDEEATWSYCEVSHVAPPKKIEIRNSILYDAFDKQVNILYVTVNGNRKSTRLAYPATDASFSF